MGNSTSTDPKTDNVKPIPQAPQTMKAFVIPAGAWQTIYDCVREAPERYATPVKQFMESLQPMDVPVPPQDD